MTSPLLRKKIAIVGTGISGLGAACLLHPYHDLVVYEKNAHIGGHSRTVEVKTEGRSVWVDTGFIVFNKRNYPLLTRLFDALKVPIAKSDMSFGVSMNGGSLEYGTGTLGALCAQKRNLLSPSFWGMIRDIWAFKRAAPAYLSQDPSVTLGACLDEIGVGPWFRDYFLLAMGGAIWSTPVSHMRDFPACTFIRFFENHGLLTLNDHPQWYTVEGGSREYVRRLAEPFVDRIQVGCGVDRVWREGAGVIVQDTRGHRASYDDVVLACHGDQALAMIQDADAQERAVLSAFRTRPNRAVLHSDVSFMPKRRRAWASWVYLGDDTHTKQQPQMCLSYWMNNLQPLKTGRPMIVTLNPGRMPDPALVHDDYSFNHPVFDPQAIAQQDHLSGIQGKNRLWFCGAYQRYGFHEDGLKSAVDVVEKMGGYVPW